MLQCLLSLKHIFQKGLHFTAVQQVKEGLVSKQASNVRLLCFVKQDNVKQVFSLSVENESLR